MENKPSHISYQAAGGVVVNDGKFLVLKRPGRGEVRLPKGHVEPDEDPREAAKREISEESGYVSLEIIADLGIQRLQFFNPLKQAFMTRDNHFYLVRLMDTAHGPSEEQFTPMWMTPAEAEAAITFEEEREFVRRAVRALAQLESDHA